MAPHGGRRGSWQRSLPYQPLIRVYLYLYRCDNTALALFELLYGLILVFTSLRCPLRPTPFSPPLSPRPQSGVGVSAGASPGTFCKWNSVVWACDLMFVLQFW